MKKNDNNKQFTTFNLERIRNVKPKLTYMKASELLTAVFQRPLEEARVEKLIQKYNPYKVNPIKVNYRNGQFYVYDGQHTLIMLSRLFGNNYMVPVIISYNLELEQEAELFATQDEGSKRLSKMDNFRSRMVYEPKAQDIFACCTEAGCTIPYKVGEVNKGRGKIVAVNELENMYDRLGRKGTIRGLTLISKTWDKDSKSYNNQMLAGVALFLDTYKDKVKDDRFIKTLSKVSAEHVLGEAGKMMGSSKAANVGWVIWHEYNKNAKGSTKLPDLIR